LLLIHNVRNDALLKQGKLCLGSVEGFSTLSIDSL